MISNFNPHLLKIIFQIYYSLIQHLLTKQAMIGDKLRKARLERGLTLLQLSELTGVGYTHIQRIEKGDHCSTSTLERICKHLNLHLELVENGN